MSANPIFKAVIMSSHVNSFGHKPAIEELLSCMAWAKQVQPMHKDHDLTKPAIGKIIDARIVPIEDGKEAQVVMQFFSV